MLRTKTDLVRCVLNSLSNQRHNHGGLNVSGFTGRDKEILHETHISLYDYLLNPDDGLSITPYQGKLLSDALRVHTAEVGMLVKGQYSSDE